MHLTIFMLYYKIALKFNLRWPTFQNFLGTSPQTPKITLSLPSLSFYSISYVAKL